ncbi:hypothetical protein CsatB_021899 [Cannabis sativa]
MATMASPSTSLMASSSSRPLFTSTKPFLSHQFQSLNKFPLTRRPQISLSFPNRKTLTPIAAASTAPPSPPPTESQLAGSTRTLTTLCALIFAITRKLSIPILNLNSQTHLRLVSAAGPLFFAALRDRPSGYLNTPLTVVAAGLSKWLDIYSGVLMVRVLLSWFPNIPWDRQPLSAIRDLCDPYLNLFRNIIPPVFDTLDVSPLLAFAVLGTLGSILSSSTGI